MTHKSRSDDINRPLVLVTGATGYIASRLIPQLLRGGYRIRCMVRKPLVLKGRPWFNQVEVVAGDVLDPSSLKPALAGVWTAYYLIHNMASGRGYTGLELDGARNFAETAEAEGVSHIIYLGGLADPRVRIAAHLRSRIETGESLRSGSVPVTEFRAGVIVGPGSISFEMIRFMTELFPIVPGPPWMKNLSQPIAARNVIDYLLAALDNVTGQGGVFEVGGPQVMRYSELMLEYARLRGLKRRMITFPYIPLWFMSIGVGLTSPVPAPIAHALIDGLRSDSRIQDHAVLRVFGDVKLISYEEAVTSSLADLNPQKLEPVWTDMGRPAVSMRHEGFFISHRTLHVEAAPEKVFGVLSGLGRGGDWLYASALWRLRGWIDRFFSPSSEQIPGRSSLESGGRMGYYRIETIEPGRRLLLRSELKAPGEGWMEWRLEPESGGTRLMQNGFFAPRGLPGFLYWYALYPFHEFVFRGLLRAIARRAKGRSTTDGH
jgi:uncharacterized protein YbjT (DUF2867 family)